LTNAQDGLRYLSITQPVNELDTVALLYEDDETHPIPFVGNLDAVLTSSAGVRLGIVIASPPKSDDTSQQRLVRKLENCGSQCLDQDNFQICG